MLTAGAGRLVSPFANDLFALVALAFKNLYPEREYAAYFVPEVEDGSGGAACGVTTFPEDGSPPVVEVSGEIPIAAGVEIFAHELAHVATPEDREHGEAWKAAFDRIFEEYNRIAQDLFGEGEEPKGILAEAEAQAAHEKEQEDEDQKRADAVDMMKHIAAAFDIPATIGEGKQEEQEKEAKQLFGWYSELKKAGFTDAQAFELIKG